MATCLIPTCDKDTVSRGLCLTHYAKHSRKGDLDQVALPKRTAHYLSNINEQTSTAVCAICGPIDLYYAKHRNKWICKGKARLDKVRNPTYVFSYGDGLTLDKATVSKAREQLTAAQGGLCAICKEPCESLALDHCHEKGTIRGLLCSRHNLGLGHFQDNVDHLRAAIAYLEASSQSASAWA